MKDENEDVLTTIAQTYIVRDSNGCLDQCSHLANNLYNASLYQLRQRLFNHRKGIAYKQLNQMFKHKYEQRENLLYASFPYRQCAQQTLREVNDIWFAFFKALAAYKANPSKFTGRPKLPKYLKKGDRHVFHVTNQNLKVKNGYLIIDPRKSSFYFKLKLRKLNGKIQRVTFKPLSKGFFKVIVQIRLANQIQYKEDNHVYIGIDPGLDNAFTCVSSNGKEQPLIINGKGIKSINQFYNKTRARCQAKLAQYHQLERIIHTKQGLKAVYKDSEQMKRVTDWRNRRVHEFAHQASKRIVDYALNNGANTIIIGKNKNQKRSSNMGKKNNQNFIGLPHQRIIEMIKYKASLQGIRVIQTNESYTSQTSWLDHELPCWQNGNKSRKKQGLSPINRRIKRGIFKSNQGILINADVNGALQIIKKVFPKASFANGIVGVVLRPIKWNALI